MKNAVRLYAVALCFLFFVAADRTPAAEIEGVIFEDNIIVENSNIQFNTGIKPRRKC